jgi:hypothetical protein
MNDQPSRVNAVARLVAACVLCLAVIGGLVLLARKLWKF